MNAISLVQSNTSVKAAQVYQKSIKVKRIC